MTSASAMLNKTGAWMKLLFALAGDEFWVMG
jgi:hypothetical protein